MPELIGDVLNWATDVQDNTLDQAAKTARLPFVMKPVALMPDAHLGYGSTVGSVIATRGAIVPASIGVDIGCGVVAVETTLTSQSLPDDLGHLHGRITRAVPAGVGQGHEDRSGLTPRLEQYPGTPSHLTVDQERTALSQFGSLGSGNHFVEVCLDERDVVWVMLHSGSRGIGNQLATIHIDKAKGLMRQYFIDLEDPDLAYLVEGSPEFEAYIADMLWAQEYALGNRESMMDAVLAQMQEWLHPKINKQWPLERSRINAHHNFCVQEHHHGVNLWVTRKGAVRARQGDLGVIPGSMGTRSYIVSGLGSKASYDSCSHGAGRRLSRGQADRTLDVSAFREAMEGKVWNDRDAESLLDESPLAYKDVDQVMADQADLVKAEHTLVQILNYKAVDKDKRRKRKRAAA